MTYPASQIVLAPLLGWLTLLALVVVGYLVRLQFIELRKNRRMQEKRAARDLQPAPPVAHRPLAMRQASTTFAFHVECPVAGRTIHKLGRHNAFSVRSPELN
ncbi:MAG TPA: hypothetical protein VEH04_00640 [Verrucomicrobiae bacterium]|nr:hypothetical protein [Verrucomicrobiae bacterium]